MLFFTTRRAHVGRAVRRRKCCLSPEEMFRLRSSVILGCPYQRVSHRPFTDTLCIELKGIVHHKTDVFPLAGIALIIRLHCWGVSCRGWEISEEDGRYLPSLETIWNVSMNICYKINSWIRSLWVTNTWCKWMVPRTFLEGIYFVIKKENEM